MKNLIFLILLPFFGFSQSELDLKIFNSINEYRVENHLKPLVWDSIMVKVSENQVNYMSKTGHLSHQQLEEDSTSFNIIKNFENKFINGGINFNSTCFENCSVVFNSSSLTLEKIVFYVVDGWKKSPTHNEILLNNQITNVAISHQKGNIFKEESVNEYGDYVITTRNGDMEWFSMNGYVKKF